MALISNISALAQLTSILHPVKGTPWLWIYLLVPLFLYSMQVRVIKSVTFVARASFDHDIQHPVESLMRSGKARFETMLLRQSKNYTAACTEYHHRYDTDPLPGFEDWYNFAVANESSIIDDFDTVYESVAPFWRLSGMEVLDALDKAHAISGSELWSCQFKHDDTSTESFVSESEL